MNFTPKQACILRRVQGNLPDCARPFAAIAEEVGRECGEPVTEDEVLELLRGLKAQGAIRRFGATLRHQKAGYKANAMVAWKLEDEAEVLRRGERMAEHPRVSHCYWRPVRPPREDWPYVLYTMVHGRSKEECLAAVDELRQDVEAAFGLTIAPEEYAVLFSVKELKKTSMAYF